MKFERPTYLINPAICRTNIRIMAGKAALSGVIFRPHFKTHQSLVIGRWFREAGITKITVSSLSAAEYFSGDGWDDITVAFPVNLRETALINSLASKVHLGLLLEDTEVAAELQSKLLYPVDIYIKIDVGYHRTGLTIDEMPDIIRLADQIKKSPKTRLKGLLTHAGHTYHASSAGELEDIYQTSTGILNQVRDRLGDEGKGLILSYGDTPSCSIIERFKGIDEIRPGNFVFYDLMQLAAGVCGYLQVAGMVVCPVVAVHPGRNEVVLYGGAIHFSKEYIVADGRKTFGQLAVPDSTGWYRPVAGAYLVSLSQEHGILEVRGEYAEGLRPGDVAAIIPVHACLTANLIHGYLLIDGSAADYFFEFD